MATFISRYVESEEIALLDAENPIPSFKDVNNVSSWAKDGLELMRKCGLIKGDDVGNFRPSDSARRSEAATIFMRFNQIVESNFVEKQEIADNDYDLSINKYKEVEYIPIEYPSTQETMSDLHEIEMEIGEEMAELERLLGL